MARQNRNIYEEAATEVARWIDDIVKAVVPEVRGGKNPPWKVQLSPQQKRDYFMAQPEQKKYELMSQMDEAERQEMARLLGGG